MKPHTLPQTTPGKGSIFQVSTLDSLCGETAEHTAVPKPDLCHSPPSRGRPREVVVRVCARPRSRLSPTDLMGWDSPRAADCGDTAQAWLENIASRVSEQNPSDIDNLSRQGHIIGCTFCSSPTAWPAWLTRGCRGVRSQGLSLCFHLLASGLQAAGKEGQLGDGWAGQL